MASFLRKAVLTVCLPALVPLSATLGAAPQEPVTVQPASLERIREDLEKHPAGQITLRMDVPPPATTFRTGVDQRVFVLTLEEDLRKELTPTLLLRQSREWASKCCGFNLDQVAAGIQKAWRRREIRKIREQIARELAELEAARKD